MSRNRTALVLIDFINLFDFAGANTLAPRALKAARHAAALKARLKQRRAPCIYANDNFGHWGSDFSTLTAQCAQKGGVSSAITETLRPAADDFAVLKPRHSAFYGTPLEFLLDELGVSRLVLAGITVDICVFATAQDAHVRQYALWVPSDCTAGFSSAHERSSLNHMARTMRAATKRSTSAKL